LSPARPHRVQKRDIGFVGNLRRAAHRRDFARALVHQEPVDQRGRIVELEILRRIREPTRQETPRRGGNTRVGDTIEPRADDACNVGSEVHLRLRCFELGALGVGGAVEEQFDLAVGRYQRDTVTFENAEIGAVAQIIALPSIAVQDHVADAGLAHGGREALAPFLRKHDVRSHKAAIAPHRLGRDIAGAYAGGNRTRGPTLARIRTHPSGQVVFRHCKIVATEDCAKSIELPRMACPKIALTMLILGSVMVLGTNARAQADTAGPAHLAQAPTPPAPPTATPSPPTTSQPAAPTSPQSPDPVGSVATLQGTASVTRNNATSALALRDPIYKNDLLQTNVDGTLGITFDDETTFTLKPNTRLAVDEFVYQEGGTDNAAIFNVVRGTAAFVAAEVAHTGNMKIDTPTSSLGIRGTTGLVEVPEGGTAGGQVSIKLYPDADGRVGRIEVFGRDGAQLGILSRGATGFAVRPGAGGRFTVAPLQISALEAERDRSFVRQTFAARTAGRQIIQQRRTLQQQQRNQQRPGQLPGREQRPGLQQQRPELRTVPGGQPLPSTGQRPPSQQQQPGARPTQQQPGAPAAPQQQQPGARPTQQQPGVVPPGGRPNAPTLQQSPGAPPTPPTPQQQPGGRPALQQQPGAAPPGGRPNAPTLQPQPGARPSLRRQPGALPGPQRAPAGQRKPAKKNESR
jgi:hypothetical protein